MILIILLAILVGLKFFEVSFVENLSWWWVAGFAFLTFLWFEFFERMLGLDKRKEDAHYEKIRKERLKRNFKDKKK
jgi:small Trp-rich protein